jgi:hypothetical protein
MTRRAALALAVALAASAARAGDVSAHATLHVRATGLENLPGTEVLYDRAARTFDLAGYLVPSEDDRYGSTFASFSLDGSGLGGDLRWRLALDTGELRRRSFPLVANVCWAETPTGLQEARLGCGTYRVPPGTPLRVIGAPVEETREGQAELTSNGRPLADEVEATLLVREAYAALSFGRAGFATVRAGRKRVSVGDGFVYDDYATGAELALDLGAVGPPLALTLSLFQPTRDTPGTVEGISPLVALRADWLPSLFEHAGLFAAVHRDRTGSVAELFRGAIVERTVEHLAQTTVDTQEYQDAARNLLLVLALPLESDATLAWLGTSGSLAPFRGQRLRWTAALLGGRVDRVTAAGGALVWTEDVSLRGRLLSLRWDTSLGETFGLGASFLHLSGGTFTRGTGGEYGGFLGIAPFVTATNLFFGGGLSESFAARQSAAPGVNGRGVTAPGLSVAFDPTESLGLELKAAYLTAPVEGPFGGRVYGTELDLVLSWSPRDWLVVGAELDVLWPGDFFAGEETVYKTVLALDLVTP